MKPFVIMFIHFLIALSLFLFIEQVIALLCSQAQYPQWQFLPPRFCSRYPSTSSWDLLTGSSRSPKILPSWALSQKHSTVLGILDMPNQDINDCPVVSSCEKLLRMWDEYKSPQIVKQFENISAVFCFVDLIDVELQRVVGLVSPLDEFSVFNHHLQDQFRHFRSNLVNSLSTSWSQINSKVDISDKNMDLLSLNSFFNSILLSWQQMERRSSICLFFQINSESASTSALERQTVFELSCSRYLDTGTCTSQPDLVI